MAVRTRNVADRRGGDSRFQDLKTRLVAEWRGEASSSSSGPDILEETDAAGRIVHVFVTWDDWADLDAQTRSEMIVDAFTAVRGENAISYLSMAMGLTTPEAARMGILRH